LSDTNTPGVHPDSPESKERENLLPSSLTNSRVGLREKISIVEQDVRRGRKLSEHTHMDHETGFIEAFVLPDRQQDVETN
jgi:hypothetical protein